MAQLTADINVRYKVDNTDSRGEQFVDANSIIYAGSGVGLNASTNYSRQLVGGDIFLGFADAQAANVTNPLYPGLISNGLALGAAGAVSVDLRVTGILVLPIASVAGATGVANNDQLVYMSDGNTFTLAVTNDLLTVTGTPTGGATTLNVTQNGSTQTTATIAYNALASAVQTALQALSNVGAGNMTVTGSAGGPWTVQGAPGVPFTIAVGTNSLTGGSSPNVTIGTPALLSSISQIGKIQNSLNGNLGIYFKGDTRR